MSARDLFVSYGTRDAQEIAEDIVADLEARGVVCWIAPRDIPAGSRSWASEIVKGIRSSGNFLLLLSAGANASEEIEKELDEAARQRKPLFVLRIEDIEPSEGLGYHLNRVQWRDLFRNREVVLSELVARTLALRATSAPAAQTSSAAVQAADGPVPAATALQVPNPAERSPLRYAVVAVLAACALLVAGLWLRPSPRQEIAAVVVPASPAAPVQLAAKGPAAAPPRSDAPSPAGSPAPTAELSDQAFAAALEARLSQLYPSRQDWRTFVLEHLRLGRTRAFAVAHSDAFRNTAGWPSAALAEEHVLEACQVRHSRPCSLMSIDNALAPLSAEGRPVERDMPRVNFSGGFDPAWIPAVSPATRMRSDVLAYRAAPGPKAVVLDLNNRLHVAVTAASQFEAERQAFRQCNEEVDKRSQCLLYAAGNDIVLSKRSLVPLASLIEPTDVQSVMTRAILAADAMNTDPAQRAKNYLAASRDRALASTGAANETWFAANAPSAEAAREWALERCEMRFGKPCGLVALNEAVVPFQPRRIPRVSYGGHYDPTQIPGVTQERRGSREAFLYSIAPEFKAAAIHAWGRLFMITGGASKRAAEEAALAACNNDPARAGREGPCLLYATGNDVVLPQRSRNPVSAAP